MLLRGIGYIENPCGQGGKVTMLNIKKYRNLLTRIIARSKDNYDADIIEKHEQDKRKVWQQINKMTNRKTRKKLV